MIEKIINLLIKRTSYYNRLLNYDKLEEYWKWLYSGKPIPPLDIVKQMTVKEYANRYGIRTMVETGTYLGSMVSASRGVFERIYSIELDDDLFRNALKQFEGCSDINIVQGDSSSEIRNVLENASEACLFWLDGHYMPSVGARGNDETPVLQEIEHISNHPVKGHVLLVDDARHFVGENDYPSIEEFRTIVSTRFPQHTFEVQDDIIRIAPALPY